MSLKAKIEAVIYAAEEPVTLGQLLGLFGGEAAAELRRRESAQAELPLVEGGGNEGPGSGASEPGEAEGEVAEGGAGAEVADASDTEDAGGAVASRREERERSRRVREMLRGLVDELIGEYATEDRGLEIREVAGGFRMATKPEYHDAVRGFARTLKPPLKLSLQALETLAVVAYKQPVTAPEVSEIRGVDSGGVLGSLMGRKLVQTAGRKQVIGRPILYKTTKDFLLRFGLKDIGELPSIEEFEKMAGEMVQEEMAMTAETGFDDRRDGYGVESAMTTRPGDDLVGAGDGTASIGDPRWPGKVTIPQADGDETVSTEDAEPVDGRMVGLDPPDMEPGGDASVDSPALDAEVQSGERSGS